VAFYAKQETRTRLEARKAGNSRERENDLMYETITIEEAQAHLAELIAGLTPGQEIIITSKGVKTRLFY
jgi:hypothetical protein